MARNQGAYVIYPPQTIGEGLYNAVNPSATNPFVTQSVLDSAIGLNNELSEVLANGNITDGNDIAVSTGDSITGVVELTLVGAAGASLTATTLDVDIASTAADVNITGANAVGITATADSVTLTGGDRVILNAASQVTATATAGNITLTATAADVVLSAGADVDITAVVETTVVSPRIVFTVTRLALGLVEYADNAAALAGGLVAGDSYILAATKAVTIVQ